MNHNWDQMILKVVENALGKTLNGKDGTWEWALYQLISEGYKQRLDKEDQTVLCVLIVLHEAVIGKVSLDELATYCVRLSRHAEIVRN